MKQNFGCILDEYKNNGYIVSRCRGAIKEWINVLFYLVVTQMIKHNWRLNQLRGVAEIISASAQLVDCFEMLEAELMSAKTASKFALKVKVDNPVETANARVDYFEVIKILALMI